MNAISIVRSEKRKCLSFKNKNFEGAQYFYRCHEQIMEEHLVIVLH